jgi:hypothetical protein
MASAIGVILLAIVTLAALGAEQLQKRGARPARAADRGADADADKPDTARKVFA